MVNTPIPHSLKSEAKKAAKILRDFTMPNAKAGPDKLIPVGILAKAKGLAILTVFKAGFLVTARGGSGIVIAKTRDCMDYSEGWSAPSAIGMAGLGGGFEIGMEVTDFVIILNSKAAVEAFSKGGNLTLGGNFTIAVGPLGRNVEGDVAVRSPAAIYTYSKTKGIFAGISVEGSALIERKDANRKFYGRAIRAYEILAGEVDPPEECEALYKVMKDHQELAAKAALKLAKQQAAKHADTARDRFADSTGFTLPKFPSSKSKESGESSSKSGSSWSPSFSKRSTVTKTTVTRAASSASSRKPPSQDQGRWAKEVHTVTKRTTTTASSKSSADPRRGSMPDATHGASASAAWSPFSSSSGASNFGYGQWGASAIQADHTPTQAVAVFPYTAQLSCDLSFNAGDQVEVLTRTDTQDDWWEGRVRGRVGIFPANYVSIL